MVGKDRPIRNHRAHIADSGGLGEVLVRCHSTHQSLKVITVVGVIARSRDHGRAAQPEGSQAAREGFLDASRQLQRTEMGQSVADRCSTVQGVC